MERFDRNHGRRRRPARPAVARWGMLRASALLSVLALGVLPGRAQAQYDVFDEQAPAPAPGPRPWEVVPDEPKARLMVLLVPVDPGEMDRALHIGQDASGRLAANLDMHPADLLAAMDPPAAADRRQDIQDALDAAGRGLSALEATEYADAAAELDLAVSTMLSHIDGLKHVERQALDLAILALAAATLLEGDEDAADDLFVALAQLSPAYRPEAGQVPVHVVRRYERVQVEMKMRETGSVRVTTNPEGVAVYVDGMFRGLSNLEVDDLARGQHAVVLQRHGYYPFGTLTPVAAERRSQIDVDLEPRKREAGQGASPIDLDVARDPDQALALGQALGLDRLAVLRFEWRPGETPAGYWISGLWTDVTQGTVLGRVEPTYVPQDDAIAVDTVVAAIAAAEEAQQGGFVPVVEAPPPDPPGLPLVERWWFWPLVGVAAAAVAAATVTYVAANQPPSPPPPSGHIFGF